jgi:hypothetical protein
VTDRRQGWLALVLFAVLATLHTWPLATAPASLSRNNNDDTILNEWVLAWVAHQAVTDPVHLFDANIFYPERRTLAYAEHLLVPAAMGAPLFWAGASPVLVYNLLLLAGFTLTGWATWYVVWRWTGDAAAGVLSGVLVAFNAHTLTRLPHLQAQHAEFLPLALLSFDSLLTTPRPRHALRLAGWFALQALVSFYLLVFTATALVSGWVVRPEDWWGARARRVVPLLAVAGAIAVVIVLPSLWPYTQLGVVRSLDEVGLYSAHWRDYLATPARIHYSLWSARWFGGTALFPGFTALALTAVAIARGDALTDRRARMALAFGVVGMALSFGPAMPGYAVLYEWLPPLAGIRGAARFGYLTIVATGWLAGFGLAALRARWRGRRWVPIATIAVIAVANLESLAAPVGYVAPQAISPLHNRLPPHAVVVEFPFYPPDRTFHNAQYLLESTHHWRPMLNGYSGLVPASYVEHYQALRDFPDARAIEALRAAGVTHVFVHHDEMRKWSGAGSVDALSHTLDLRLIGADAQVGLYTLTPKSAP